jgi:hypothetical protein
MTVGLQVWDEQGRLMIDQTTVLGRLVGIIDANTASGSAYVAGLDQGVPFAIPMLQQDSAAHYGTNTYPNCTFNGNVVSWTRQAYPTGVALAACKLLLGVR